MEEKHPHHHETDAPKEEHLKLTKYPRPSLIVRASTGILKVLLKHRWKLLFLGILFLLIVNYPQQSRKIITILLLTIIASFSTFYKFRVKISLGVELVTMATVLTSLVYGPVIGAIVGIISSTLSVVLPQMVDASDVFYVVAHAVVAFVVYALRGWPLMALVIIAMLIEWAMSEPIRLLSGSIELRTMAFLYMSSNLIWNILVFIYIAPPVYNLMIG